MQSGTLATERERLCRALTRVVDERGWAGTSPALVARAAGLTTSGFYDEFRSLEHCCIATYDEMLARLTRIAERALADVETTPGPRGWREQLDALMNAVLWFFSLETALARTCLVEALNAGPAMRARRDAALGDFARYVESLRLANGEPMPRVAAELIVFGTTELIYKRVARGEADRLPQLLPELRSLWSTTVTEHADPAGDALALR